MKVLHVIETLGVGGAERLLVMLLPEMVRQGDRVVVAVLRGPLNLQSELERAGVTVISLPKHHKWNLWAGARNISQVAREQGCDIIHAHLYFPAVYSALARTLRLTKAITVLTFHNLAYQRGANPAGIGLFARRALAFVIYRTGIDKLLAVSEAVAKHYGRAFCIKGISVVHNPIDLNAIDHILETQPSVTDRGHISIFMPGRLVHEKGHLVFFEALALLREQSARFSVTIAGDGPLKAILKTRIATLGLDQIVSFSGMLNHADLIRAMASADIIVVPSLLEGFGLTALEGMAVRRPVIASTAGGLPEVIQDQVSGILVPPGNAPKLAQALDTLIADSGERTRLGAGGRARAEKLFALPKIADEMQAIYKSAQSATASGLH